MIKKEWVQEITEDDFSKFKEEFMAHIHYEHDSWGFNLRDNLVSVSYRYYKDNSKTSYRVHHYVKVKQSFKDECTYHLYDEKKDIIYDSELFFKDNCKNTIISMLTDGDIGKALSDKNTYINQLQNENLKLRWHIMDLAKNCDESYFDEILKS